MKCHELAQRIEQLQDGSSPIEIARACLLLANSVSSMEELSARDDLAVAWREMGLKMKAATDQHAAMTEELEALANSDPRQFSPDQIWVLIRAIKVQSQILQMYLGYPVLDV